MPGESLVKWTILSIRLCEDDKWRAYVSVHRHGQDVVDVVRSKDCYDWKPTKSSTIPDELREELTRMSIDMYHYGIKHVVI